MTAATPYPPPAALWSLGFRPFFLAAGLWAALAIGLWIVLLASGEVLPSRFDPLAWHIHAMLFGLVPAAAAGFLLTAIPNWTGRRPIHGSALVMLTALWLLGRIACFVSALLPIGTAATVDVAFLFVLCIIAAKEIIVARSWRNLMMPVPIGLLGIADLLMHLEYAGISVPSGLGWRLAIMATIALVSAVGGRILPVFTRNWLAKRGAPGLTPHTSLLDRSALGALHTGLLVWALQPAFRPTGTILIIASLLNFCRLARWRGWMTRSEPLLAILHVGYGWVALGAGLLGASVLWDSVPEAAAIHAFTAGAVGTMILAVMTRVSLGHTGRPLRADRTTVMIYTMITLAAVARVAAPFAGGSYLVLIEASALLWIASFLGFVWRYSPILTSPRIDQNSGLSEQQNISNG